jgi:hypothetical protein
VPTALGDELRGAAAEKGDPMSAEVRSRLRGDGWRMSRAEFEDLRASADALVEQFAAMAGMSREVFLATYGKAGRTRTMPEPAVVFKVAFGDLKTANDVLMAGGVMHSAGYLVTAPDPPDADGVNTIYVKRRERIEDAVRTLGRALGLSSSTAAAP